MQFLKSLFLFILFQVHVYAQDIFIVEKLSIQIPESLFIGEITYLDRDGDNLLLTDSRLQQVLLYSSESKKWNKLLPSECHPGFEFRPIEAQYGDGDEIFMTNSGIWGFRFKKDGTCIGAAHDKFLAPRKFHYGNKLIGVTTDPKNTIITGWDSTGKPAINYFDIVNKYPTAEDKTAQGGGILESNDII